MLERSVHSDVTVVGGGLAGVCAAIAAARQGRTVALINNRPVLGGNSSSEVRVWVVGATAHGSQRWARENGIIGELYVENQYRNPDGNPIYWDDVVLDAVRREPNISLHLNTDVREIQASGPADARWIDSVTGWTMGSEILTTFTSPIFLDCTGDGLVGELAGARYRLGREGRAEFDEAWAPEEPVREFLGSTLLFYTKDVGHPVKFVAPESTINIEDTPIPDARIIRSGDSGARYWWIEWGGQLDIVHDNERIRDELRGVVLGVWDYIKNSGKFDADNLTMEWIGNVPGKREYRRFVGDYTLTQNDILEQTEFPDTVAFGGWSIDLHPVEGMYAATAGAVQRLSDGVFEIPLRSLYSANVTNMLMAGRNISATHIAFGATRVMATCGAVGEAAGTTAALCVDEGVSPREVAEGRIDELHRRLLRADAPVIGVANRDPDDHALRARVSASSTLADLGAPVGADELAEEPYDLSRDVGIVIPVAPELTGLDLLLRADRDTTLKVEIWSTGRRQNSVPVELEVATEVEVPAGETPGWLTVPVQWRPDVPQNAVVVLRANPDLHVFTTPHLAPGVLSLVHGVPTEDPNVEISYDQLLAQWPTKPLRGRSVRFRSPESAALAPAQAIEGYQRPYGGPNMWCSAPMVPGGEEWLRLDWDQSTVLGEIVVVFDDDTDLELNTLHHHRSPDEIIPELVADYRIEALTEDDHGQQSWTVLAEVAGNRRRRRVHTLSTPASARSLRLVISATNGAPQARVVSFRAYAS